LLATTVAGVSAAAKILAVASVCGRFAVHNNPDASAAAVDSSMSDVIAAVTRVLTWSLLLLAFQLLLLLLPLLSMST
jgi:hypothetical protein